MLALQCRDALQQMWVLPPVDFAASEANKMQISDVDRGSLQAHCMRCESEVVRKRMIPIAVHLEHGATERLERPEEILGTRPNAPGDLGVIEAACTLKSDHCLDRRNTSVNIREHQKAGYRLQLPESYQGGVNGLADSAGDLMLM